MIDGLPEGLEKYGETKVFTEGTVPDRLKGLHDTKPGVWGRIVVLEGELHYIVPGPPEEHTRLSPGVYGYIEPEVLHRVAPEGALKFKVEFYRAAAS